MDWIVAAGWRDQYAALVVDLARFLPQRRASSGPEEDPTDEEDSWSPPGGAAPPSPRALARERLIRFLERQTGMKFGHDLRRWRRWIWQLPDEPHPDYAAFKADLYAAVDPRMSSFFRGGGSLIRLDEVDWGGIKPNGIPPLDHPRSIPAREAAYLGDRNVVFGVALNGEARAYPKRILAWHELVRDRIGDLELTIVYCTLCGTVIPYASEAGGRRYTFGTSGLLYRSNKLMFDEETGSLWSTNQGRPVLGPAAGSSLELVAYPVVTTTWREWLARHPDTTVLSKETGYDRDYSEGAAYKKYFSNDKLIFEVPRTDERLKSKAEVLTLLLRPAGAGRQAERRPLALSQEFLKKKPVHQLSFAGHDLVVVTSPDGANRVYAAAGTRFARIAADGRHLVDESGHTWEIGEDALSPDGRDEPARWRIPARRAFWFGWYAQFPETELVK